MPRKHKPSTSAGAPPAPTAPTPDYPHIRPGLVIYSDSWDAPCIVVRRSGEDIDLVTGGGYTSTKLKNIAEDRETPRPGSALDLLADHIAAGFNLTDETRPFHRPSRSAGRRAPAPARASDLPAVGQLAEETDDCGRDGIVLGTIPAVKTGPLISDPVIIFLMATGEIGHNFACGMRWSVPARDSLAAALAEASRQIITEHGADWLDSVEPAWKAV